MNPSRTIHLSHRGSALKPILLRLGIGEYRRRPSGHAEANLWPPGWYISPAEQELLDAELAKSEHRRPSDNRESRAEYQRRAKARADEARARRARLSPVKRLLEKWREECANPAPYRKEPLACWRFLLKAYGLPLDTPMPAETPPPPIVLRAEDFMRSLDTGGDALLLRPGTVRRQP